MSLGLEPKGPILITELGHDQLVPLGKARGRFIERQPAVSAPEKDTSPDAAEHRIGATLAHFFSRKTFPVQARLLHSRLVCLHGKVCMLVSPTAPRVIFVTLRLGIDRVDLACSSCLGVP